jgi:ribonuclease J
MHITIHRGTHEIGGNCVEIATDNSRIILDVGMPLFKSAGEPYDTGALKKKSKQELLDSGILPKVSGLFVDGLQPDAILLSHAHEDHTGLLRHSAPEIPIYTSVGTSKMMMAGAKFALQPVLPRERHRELKSGAPVQIGDFTVTAYSVDHSIYGAQAFLIEAGEKKILYSGDLRMHGRKPGMHRSLIEAVASRNIDVLLMEGTHIGHSGHKGANEYQLEEEITGLIKSAPGITLASFLRICCRAQRRQVQHRAHNHPACSG